MSGAIVTRLFNQFKTENMSSLSAGIDGMSPMSEPFTTVYTELNKQVAIVTLKEVYGYAVILAIVILSAIVLSDYRQFLIPKRFLSTTISEIEELIES